MFLDPQQRTVAIGVWVTSYSAGAAVGPLLGGVLLEHFWWGSVFLLARAGDGAAARRRPAAAARVPRPGRRPARPAQRRALARRRARRHLRAQATPRTDGLGGAASSRSSAGLAVGALFVRRQRTLADPLIDLRLFRVPAFSAALATNTLGVLRRVRLVPLHRAVPAARARPLAARGRPVDAARRRPAFIAGSMLRRRARGAVGPAHVMAGGLAVAAAGFVVLTQVGAGAGCVLVVGSVVFALGLAPVAHARHRPDRRRRAPPERAGAAAGDLRDERGARRRAGHRRARQHRHRDLPPQAADDVPAGGPAAGARHARRRRSEAQRLGGGLGDQVLGAAHGAFTEALQVHRARQRRPCSPRPPCSRRCCSATRGSGRRRRPRPRDLCLDRTEVPRPRCR